MRDAVTVAAGAASSNQYVTFHDGAQGGDDWIGWELAFLPGPELRFTSLSFQEGEHFADGGWWKDLHAEVRAGGTWTPVKNAFLTPAYPFALAGQPFFDGTGFQ